MAARIAAHPTRPASWIEVEREFSTDDVIRWHHILDEIDECIERQRQRPPSKE